MPWRSVVGAAGDLADLAQIRIDFAPAPAVRQHLHLVGGDAALGELARRFTGVGKPGPLRRRIGLGADPGMQLRDVGIHLVHQLGRAQFLLVFGGHRHGTLLNFAWVRLSGRYSAASVLCNAPRRALLCQ
jgi:hypothetical protein